MGRSIFEEAKDFFNHVKEFHDNLSFKKRLSILSYEFKNRSLGRFFGTKMKRLDQHVQNNLNNGLGDYTKSIAWNYQVIELCQTRNLGYLPYYIAREQAEEFRQMIT